MMKHRNRKLKFQAPVFLPHKRKRLPMFSLAAFALTVAAMHATKQMLFMETSWDGFLQSMNSFFQDGLGGPGMQGVGIAIAAIGLVAAAISFAVHKFNPQSRMPGWITCLVIGLIGTFAMTGISKPLQILNSGRDLIFSWFGV